MAPRPRRAPALENAHLLPRFRDRAAMLDAQRAAVRKAASEAVGEGRAVTLPSSAVGSPRDLRGLPIIAPGVGGTSPGTDPVRELLRKEERQTRK